jgi:hypothetical protein
VLQKAREVAARIPRLPVEDIGALVLKVLTTSKPKVRYAIVPDRLETWGAAILPRRMVDRIIAGMLGIRRLKRADEECALACV